MKTKQSLLSTGTIHNNISANSAKKAKNVLGILYSQRQNFEINYSTVRAHAWRKLKQAGFNAIELSLVLGVIAIATVVIIRAMGGNSDKQNANQMVNDVSTFVSNVKNAYSSSTDGYTNLNTAAAIDGRMVPPDLKTPGGTAIQSQFQGGTVEVASGTNGENFTITYSNVPSAICNSAINTLGGASFLTVVINDKTVYDVNNNVQLDATGVSKACKDGGEQSTIIFTAS